MNQGSFQSFLDYLNKFKSARNWCHVSLAEKEFQKMTQEVLELEYPKKFQGTNTRQFKVGISKKIIRKLASKDTHDKNP